MDSVKSTANKFLAIPLALFAIITALESTGHLVGTSVNWANMFCIGMFGLGIILYIFWGAAKLWGTTEYTFHVHRMKPSQMDISIELSKKLFPSIPTKRELKQIYKVNNAVCKLQYRNIRFLGFNIAKHTGVCSIAPMTNEARKLLEKEKLDGLRMTPEHLTKSKSSHACLYIGAVGAIGTRAKKHILIFLSGLIDNEFENGTEVIFTRPTTKDGLRTAKKFGFVPVKDDAGDNELNRLYRIYKNEYDNLLITSS